MSHNIINITEDPRSIVMNYIQTTLRKYAIVMTGHRMYDADDFVQETALRFLSANYWDRSIVHQKRTAKKIMANLFRQADLHDIKIKTGFDNITGAGTFQDPECGIDIKNLLLYIRERKDPEINFFWLQNIGYSTNEIAERCSESIDHTRRMILSGRKKLSEILKNESFTVTEKPQNSFRKIFQFSIDGTLKKTWASLDEIEKIFSFKMPVIMRCLQGIIKVGAGSIWAYSDRVDPLNPPAEKKLRIPWEKYVAGLSRPVYQFDLTGLLIRKWASRQLAEKTLEISPGSIRKAISRPHRCISNGFMWAEKNEIDSKYLEKKKPRIRRERSESKAITQCLGDGTVLNEFPSIYRAIKFLKETAGVNGMELRKKSAIKTFIAYGYHWKLAA